MTMNVPGLPARTEYRPVDATAALDGVTLTKDGLKHAFYSNLFYVQGKIPTLATRHDYYVALALTVRDQMLHRWISTAEAYTKHGSRTVAYFSAEFLMGPHLGNNVLNLGLEQVARQALMELGLDYDELGECEEEPGLGNGGLGRLAACFLDSLATLEIPTIGYGIRYEFGIFQQEITDGWQVEKTDKWLRFGNAWEIARPEWAVEVKLGGYTEHYSDEHERIRTRWVPQRTVVGVPYDTPILGYHVNTANTLRLWRAEATESFDFSTFNRGDYYGAVNQKVPSENLHQGPLPERRGRAGQGAAPRAAVLLRVLLAAGHAAHPQDPGHSARAAAREVHRAVERHPSGHRGRRTDAVADRRERDGLGYGLGDHAPDLRLHQSHAVARG